MTERQRVLQIGFTEKEASCWELSVDLARRFFELPDIHSMDDHEVTHAIHVIQNKLLARPAYRKYLQSSQPPTPQ